MRMPDAVLEILPAAVRSHVIFSQAAEANWDSLRSCYPSEQAALAAVTDCRAVLLPYGADSLVAGFYEKGMAVNRSSKISGCYEVLKQKFEDKEVLQVITKNPGVLGCQPAQLHNQSPDDIRRLASLAGGINGVFGAARRFVEASSWWDEGICKVGPSSREDDEELELPSVMLEGKEYLYDFFGEYMGVEQLLLAEEGDSYTPVAVWNPELQEVELAEFVAEEAAD